MGYFRDNIKKLAGYTPGFQPKSTGQVIKLNTNENPYPPSPRVLEAIGKLTGEQLRRYPDPTGEKFRKAAAKLNGVGPENIMCCNGGDDLLTIAFRAFCDKYRPVVYPVPTYTLYAVLAQIQYCRAIEIPFEDDFTLPDELFVSNAALTIVCNPNAPTATLVSKDALAELADEIEGVLLIDEAYVDFAKDNCAEMVKKFDNVLILRSMSKGYSLAGLRFGYAIGSAELIAGLMKVKDSYNVDAVAIEAATAAIKDQSHFRENVEKIKSERKRLTCELNKLKLDVGKSGTNFVFARCGNARQVYEELAERSIYVRYFPLEGLFDKLRITVGTAEQNDKLLAALKEILQR